MMRTRFIQRFTYSLLAVTTLIVLLMHPPTLSGFGEVGLLSFVLYVGLTAIALSAGVLLGEMEFSVAHAVGILAFLTLPGMASAPAMMWGVFGGSVLGGLGMLLRLQEQLPRQRLVRRGVESIVMMSSRTTLSYFAAWQVYVLRGLSLPLTGAGGDVFPPLLAYAGVYTAAYGALYAVEFHLEGYSVRRLARTNWLAVSMVLILPVAFAIVGALVINDLPLEAGLLVVAATVLMIIVPFGYSRSGYVMRQQLNELQQLSDLVQALQTTTGTSVLLSLIERRLPSILDTRALIVSIVERDTKKMIYPVVMRDGQPLAAPEVDRADAHLIAWLAQSREPLLISEAVAEYLQEQRTPPHAEPITSWMGAPMVAGGRVVGTVVAISHDNRYFTQPDLRLLRIIASTLAVAIDNSQLYELQQERVVRLNTLNTVSVLLTSTLDVGSVLDTITTTAAMLAESDAVALFLNEKESDPSTVSLSRSAGLSPFVEQAYQKPLLGRLPMPTVPRTLDSSPLDANPPLVVTDVTNSPETRPLRDVLFEAGFGSLMEMPLMNGEMRIGVIGVYYHNRQSFGAEAIEFLRTFANEAVQAIRNAQLYTRTDAALDQRLAQLSILADIVQKTNASISAEEISQATLGYALSYTSAKRGFMALVNAASGELTISAQLGYPNGALANVAWLAGGVVGDVLQSGEVRRIDTPDDAPAGSHLMPDTSSQLVVPILRSPDVLGVLNLEHTEPYAFDSEQDDFIVQLVNHAAIAIDNYSLFQSVTQARDRLKVILDTISEGVLLLDNTGRVAMANPAVRLVGLAVGQAVGQTLADLIANDDRLLYRLGFTSQQDAEGFVRRVRRKEPWQVVPVSFYTLSAKSGDIYVEREIIDIRTENGRLLGALLVFHDQTEKRELDRTRDELTRMIVHDLRSPLTAVSASVGILRRVIPESLEKYAVVDQTLNSTDSVMRKLMSRVDSILDVAKMESGEIHLEQVTVSLATLVGNVFAELQPIADENNITFQTDLPDDLPQLYADPEKTERVLQNLLDNALKYTTPGTSVTVRARPAPANGGAPYLHIDVMDRGPGIPLEYKERLFDRYMQMEEHRNARRGVGLGLTFCRLVVDAHGGSIWIQDNPGGGSIFSFTLPLATDAVQQADS